MIKMNNKSGITLISLVVTIIVLLILAGISIQLVVGDSGILTKSSESKDDERFGEIEEEVSRWKAEQESASRLNSSASYEDIDLYLYGEDRKDDGKGGIYEKLLTQLKSEGKIEDDDVIDRESKTITVYIGKSDKTKIVSYALTSRIAIHADSEGQTSDINMTYEWGMTWEDWVNSTYNKKNLYLTQNTTTSNDGTTTTVSNVSVNTDYPWMVVYDKTDKGSEYAVSSTEKISKDYYYEVDWDDEYNNELPKKLYTVMVYANFINFDTSIRNDHVSYNINGTTARLEKMASDGGASTKSTNKDYKEYKAFKVTFEKGMTWEEWIDSEYNTNNVYIGNLNNKDYIEVDSTDDYNVLIAKLQDWNDSDSNRFNKNYTYIYQLRDTVIDENAHYEMSVIQQPKPKLR